MGTMKGITPKRIGKSVIGEVITSIFWKERKSTIPPVCSRATNALGAKRIELVLILIARLKPCQHETLSSVTVGEEGASVIGTGRIRPNKAPKGGGVYSA